MKHNMIFLTLSFALFLAPSGLSAKTCYAHLESRPELKVWPKNKATPQIHECSCPCTAPRLEQGICFQCGHYVKEIS